MTTNNTDITYEWSVNAMECYPEKNGYTDVVFTIHWSLSGIKIHNEKPFGTNCYGTVGVELNDDSVYTPYEELTKEQVTEWIIAALGEEQVNNYYNSLANQIEKMINPPSVSLPLPWAN